MTCSHTNSVKASGALSTIIPASVCTDSRTQLALPRITSPAQAPPHQGELWLAAAGVGHALRLTEPSLSLS